MLGMTSGFTLIELSLVMAIIAIISLFAVGTYQAPIKQTECQAAKISLFSLASEMERYFEMNHTYVGFKVDGPRLDHSEKYDFYLSEVSAMKYKIAAIPRQSSDKDPCGSFYLDQDGNKSFSGKGTVADCW